jgi:chemotaxis protein MotC
MRPDEARRFYLAMAKAAITNGKTAAAQFASAKAAALAADGTPDQARATLYSAAALVASDQVDDGMTKLSSIDKSRLPADDATLRDAALSVGTIVASDNKNEGTGGDGGMTPNDPSMMLMDHARAAIENSAVLLKGAGQ